MDKKKIIRMYSDELFKDTVHLNEAGAKQFSAELQTHLQELEIF